MCFFGWIIGRFAFFSPLWGQTDSFLIARPRLHSTQRDKNRNQTKLHDINAVCTTVNYLPLYYRSVFTVKKSCPVGKSISESMKFICCQKEYRLQQRCVSVIWLCENYWYFLTLKLATNSDTDSAGGLSLLLYRHRGWRLTSKVRIKSSTQAHNAVNETASLLRALKANAVLIMVLQDGRAYSSAAA